MSEISGRDTEPKKSLRRYRFIFPPKNKYCLVGLKRHPHNWKLVVLTLCRIYNCLHAVKNKCCSKETSEARKEFYLKFFEYTAKEFNIDPRELKSNHIKVYFHREISRRLNEGTEPKVIVKRMRNELSHLTFFSWWISKPNCVPKFSEIYQAEKIRLESSAMSNFRSSQMNGGKLAEKIDRAFKLDKYFGLQVMVMANFGLRPAESVCLNFIDCFKVADGRPYIHIIEGSKGGKPRRVFAKTDSQFEAFNQISDFCFKNNIQLFRDTKQTLKEALKIQNRRLSEELGLSKELFEGSAYSMRHSFASRMMNVGASGLEKQALGVSEDLGHHRKEVTAVYVGNLERVGKDLIPKLLAALTSDPSHSKTEERLKMLFREMLASNTFLAFSLLFWCAHSSDGGAGLEILAARKQALFGKKRNLHTETVLLEKLSSLCDRGTAEQFLMSFNQSCPIEWIEKNVMSSFDANLFFKS